MDKKDTIKTRINKELKEVFVKNCMGVGTPSEVIRELIKRFNEAPLLNKSIRVSLELRKKSTKKN